MAGAVTALVAGFVAGMVSRPDGAAGQQLHPVVWSQIETPSSGVAQAIGGYAHGCLAGGRAIALDGPGYQVMRPGRNRYYGHPELLDYLQGLGRRVQGAGLGVMALGDLAQPRGGPMNKGHASHQSGLDVDVWLRLDLPPLPRDRRDDLKETSVVDHGAKRVSAAWGAGQARLLRLAAMDPRVSRIFINPIIKIELCRKNAGDTRWLRVVRPWYGHDDHFHVRLTCPADSPSCESQPPLPPGDGCDAELQSWLEPPPPPKPDAKPKAPRPRMPMLPAACFDVGLGMAAPARAAH